MEVDYKNGKLKKLCLSAKEADKKLGSNSGRKLRTRLSDIEAASNVSELIAGRPHPYTGDKAHLFSLDLHGGDRLLFEPLKKPPPKKGDGGIDWSNVESIFIVFIGDPHE
ncbi:MAG: killer suppression protein HigA [Candidatus Thiodiazotropha endolucinida]|uniref:Killer suppression protein HigA n=1 Tax=Candidatus Thiodiazotropha taylori TaxID=2792791 RepID=A0A9E4NL30_9GAMM|nr:killer suppression protein HigA [Candidatus Thiodiazotropha sp. (ex Codakia orbicularis)]MBT3043166.1 killer suppression protein HigA [Candidatus Thiodiazotropha sp. (ex Codakia orbicularis)]MCG7979231.1 killer suppression protein HigA [Candidatus Thiodiazotropha taylori]MCW4237363.1 killer suppression protein HigA [Candidatus Thiodiazotropha endolucinida]